MRVCACVWFVCVASTIKSFPRLANGPHLMVIAAGWWFLFSLCYLNLNFTHDICKCKSFFSNFSQQSKKIIWLMDRHTLLTRLIWWIRWSLFFFAYDISVLLRWIRTKSTKCEKKRAKLKPKSDELSEREGSRKKSATIIIVSCPSFTLVSMNQDCHCY